MFFKRTAKDRSAKEPTVALFYVTDLHGSEVAFRKFVNAARAYRTQALVCGGDISGKQMYPILSVGNGVRVVELDERVFRLESHEALVEAKANIEGRGGYWVELDQDEADLLAADKERREALFSQLVQERLARWIELAEERLKGTETKLYFCGGNDDSDEMLRPLTASDSDVVVAAEGRIVDVCGYPMASLGWSNPTPWSTPRETDEEMLAVKLREAVSELDDFDRAIFNFHLPPKGSSLDSCAVLDTTKWPPAPVFVGGEPQRFGAGSTAVDAIIRELQPLLGLHGHIHESAGVKKIGRTTCVNPGSDYVDGTLRGAVVALRGGVVKGVQRTCG